MACSETDTQEMTRKAKPRVEVRAPHNQSPIAQILKPSSEAVGALQYVLKWNFLQRSKERVFS